MTAKPKSKYNFRQFAENDRLDELVQAHPQRDALVEYAHTLEGRIAVIQSVEGDDLVATVDTGEIAGRVEIGRWSLDELGQK